MKSNGTAGKMINDLRLAVRDKWERLTGTKPTMTNDKQNLNNTMFNKNYTLRSSKESAGIAENKDTKRKLVSRRDAKMEKRRVKETQPTILKEERAK
jgi:hypothetical protein